MKRPLTFFHLGKSQVAELIFEYIYCDLAVMSPTKTHPLPKMNGSVI